MPVFKLLLVEGDEYCIVQVMAGPPYEDIAFKIIIRESEYGYKSGFRCHNKLGARMKLTNVLSAQSHNHLK